MISRFDPGALLGASYELGRTRVRLRMVAPSDAAAVRGLVAGCGGGDLVAERLLRFDPRRRAVVCATTLLGGAEVIVGVGAIELDGEAQALPNPLLLDARAPDGLGDLLAGALLGRAQMLARTRTA